MKEIRSLTGIRGLAALYVATYHFLQDYTPGMTYQDHPFILHGYISVDIFFILSGFVMTLSSKKLFAGGFQFSNYKIFMKRRFARIYPVYILYVLIAFFTIDHMKDLLGLGLDVVLLQVFSYAHNALGPTWSLSAEWLAYLSFPLLIALVYKYKGSTWTWSCVVLGFAMLILVPLDYHHIKGGWQVLQYSFGYFDRFSGPSAIIRCFGEYIIGMALYKFYADEGSKYAHYFPALSVISVVGMLALLCIPLTDFGLVLLAAMLILSISFDQGPVARFLGSRVVYFLGEISYSLYLAHTMIVKADRALYDNFLVNHTGDMAKPIAYLLFYGVLILVSYITYKFVEIPARDYLRKRAAC